MILQKITVQRHPYKIQSDFIIDDHKHNVNRDVYAWCFQGSLIVSFCQIIRIKEEILTHPED